MPLLLSSTLIFVLALLLLAWEASRPRKSPFVVLAGLGLVGAAFMARLVAGGGLLPILTGILTDAGVALVFMALFLAFRKKNAASALGAGLALLGLAGLLMLAGHFLKSNGFFGAAPAETLLVELGPDDHLEEIGELLGVYGLTAELAFPGLTLGDDEDLAQTFLVHGPPQALAEAAPRLRADRENVDHVEWNVLVSLDPVETARPGPARAPVRLANDPLVGQQWGLAAIGADGAYRLIRDRQPVRKAVVAILDTGVDAAHEDVSAVFGPSPATTDQHGHGSHCAGLAGAATHNRVGMASLNWEGRFVEVRGYAALQAGGAGTLEQIAQAVLDATRDGADVLSMSLGQKSPLRPRLLEQAVEFAQERGVIVVASAGNAFQDARDHTPSNIAGVIAVAAVDQDLRRARFSNSVGGLGRPLAAPGVDMISLVPGGDYLPRSGTSMATPVVAGLIGVMRALDPSLSAEEVYEILHATGTDVEDTPTVGRVVHAEAAIEAVLGRL